MHTREVEKKEREHSGSGGWSKKDAERRWYLGSSHGGSGHCRGHLDPYCPQQLSFYVKFSLIKILTTLDMCLFW